jgi:hypothetical protein
MRYLKGFNEDITTFSLEQVLKEQSEEYLAYLLDKGFEIVVSELDIHIVKNTTTSQDFGEVFYWEDIKDSLIPYLHILSQEYDFSLIFVDYGSNGSTQEQKYPHKSRKDFKSETIFNNEKKVDKELKNFNIEKLLIRLSVKDTGKSFKKSPLQKIKSFFNR